MKGSCPQCKHYDPKNLAVCAAFPAGIPLPILSGEVAHTKAYPNDRNLRFEAAAAPATPQPGKK